VNTIALSVPVLVGIECSAAFGLAWLCWRLAERRHLLPLRDITRAFVALGLAALTQLADLRQFSTTNAALLDISLSLAMWLYIGFLIAGAIALANNESVTVRVRREAVLGALLAALLTGAISLVVARDVATQDMIRNAVRAGGTILACLIIARVISRAASPDTMVLGASVVRVALCVIAACATFRVGLALYQGGGVAEHPAWQSVVPLEFLAHCILGLGLVVWLLDRDWALASQSVMSAEHRAASDALTGLPNRTIVLDRLEMAVASARRSGTQVGVLYIDLDDFKGVNDRHGHLAGDDVLKAVGARLLTLLRASDTVGRMGGDEFVAISPYLRQDSDLEVVISKVREALQSVVERDGVSISVDGSVGAALFPRDGDTPEALLSAADHALYRDKSLRRPGPTRRVFTPRFSIATA
jgi:diguanylate cyclase (GGDEF)-like protein